MSRKNSNQTKTIRNKESITTQTFEFPENMAHFDRTTGLQSQFIH